MNLGFTEIFFIFVIALIVFGPRKLPELGKSLGETLAHFKRASEDFKRSWETEVELEKKRTIAPPRVEPRPIEGQSIASTRPNARVADEVPAEPAEPVELAETPEPKVDQTA